MNDELSQLDELIESDVLDALGVQSPAVEEDTSAEEVDDIIIEDFEEIQEKSEVEEEIQDNKVDDTPIENSNSSETNIMETDDEDEELLEKEWEEELDSKQSEEVPPEIVNTTDMKSTDLASLLGQLLNNKTIEITIKIKD